MKNIVDMIFNSVDNFCIGYYSIIDSIIYYFYILCNELFFEKELFYFGELESEDFFDNIYLCGVEFLFIDIEFSFIFEIYKRISIFFYWVCVYIKCFYCSCRY